MRSLPAARVQPTVLVAALIATALASPARAAETPSGPTTLGPDLSKYSDSNQYGCSSNPFTGVPTGALDCTWASVNPSDQDPLIMFGAGQISQITVKVGASTGPMKVVVIHGESSFSLEEPESQPSASCCTDIAESQPFTPTANSTTTVPVNLPVPLEETSNPESQRLTLSYAYLGLSPLEDNVPVPAATGVHETIETPVFGEGPNEEPIETGQKQSEEVSPSALLEQPALQIGAAPQTPQTGKGVLVLMDAVYTPTPGAPTIASLLASHIGAATSRGPSQTPGSSLGPAPGLPGATSTFPVEEKGVHIKRHRAIVELSCASSSPCSGRVSLQSAPAPGHVDSASAHKLDSKQRRLVSYATGDFALTAGGSKSIPLELSAAGRRLARRHRTLDVWVQVSVSTPKPAATHSDVRTLRF
jgi:hypothetical protein